MGPLDAATSTWGIAQPVRKVLRQSILALREALEDDARRQLASLGITAAGVGAAPGSRELTGEEAHARDVVTALIESAWSAGDPPREAFDDVVREIAFTFLDRAVALRCLEERGLLIVDGQAETVIKRDPVRGSASLVWQIRSEGDRRPREVAQEAFRRACAAVTERVRELFDPDAEHAILFPLLPTWEQVITALNDPAVPSETYAEDEVLGWVYQYWNSAAKRSLFEEAAAGVKVGTGSSIAVASCTYTPRYIVDYLVQNTLGATWLEMHPDSQLATTWPYYVRPPEGNPPVDRPVKRVRDITLLDPACGSGHFLVRAFEVFAQLYAEEGIEDPAEVPTLILEHNLHGIDIDRRAVQIAALVLYLKGCTVAGPDFRPSRLNLVAADIVLPPQPPPDLLATFEEPELVEIARSLWAGLQGIRDFGSLLHPERTVDEAFAKLREGIWEGTDVDWQARRSQLLDALHRAFEQAAGDTDLGRRLFGQEAERGLDLLQLLAARYDVVVANPPYVIAGSLEATWKRRLKEEYRESSRDLYSSFIARCMGMTVMGVAGLVTRDAWLFGKRFAAFREQLLEQGQLATLAHLGTHAFEEIGGGVVSVVAFSVRGSVGVAGDGLVAIGLTSIKDAALKASTLSVAVFPESRYSTVVSLRELRSLPEAPIVYSLGPVFLRLLSVGPHLRDQAPAMEGLHTGDDDRFLRLFWETSPGRSVNWVPYSKGGGYGRWAGLDWHSVLWGGEGAAIKATGNAIIPSQDKYFNRCLVYTDFASGSLGVRAAGPRVIFGDKGPAIDAGSNLEILAGLLNSRLASYLLRAIAPSMQFRTGYVNALPMPRDLVSMTRDASSCALKVKSNIVAEQPTDRAMVSLPREARNDRSLASVYSSASVLLHSLEGWNERLVFDGYELNATDVQAVLDETAAPPGWHPLIVGYDRLPEPPEGIAIPDGLSAFLDTLEHRRLSAAELAAAKARLRRLYEAGPGAKEDEEPVAGEGDDDEGAALGARIPIPTETFLEELAAKMELHPISVHWLLEGLRAEGVVSPPEEKREREDYVSVTLLRMLGYRWPEQDAHDAEHGPILDPDLVDADGIIPLVPCADEPVAAERVRTRLERQLGEEGAERFLVDFKRYTKRELPDWLERDFFKRHARQFKNRPIAWHLRSAAGHFSALVLYHRLSRETLETLRTTYAGGRIARLRADQERARQRGQTETVSTLQVAIEDVEAFRARLEAIERADTPADRIRCRWKETDTNGRPGPYAPDIDDGVKVNIRPFQEQGLLAAKVITKW